MKFLANCLAWTIHAKPVIHEMCMSWTIRKVQRLRRVLILLVYVYMLSSVVLAVPRPAGPVVSEDEMGRQVITFYNKPCIPVDPKHLHQRMGAAFDTERMAMDEAAMKRAVLKSQDLKVSEEEERNYVEEEDLDEDEGEVNEDAESQSDYSSDQWLGRSRRDLDDEQTDFISSYYKIRNSRSLQSNSKLNKRSIRKSLKSILKRLERKQRKRRNPSGGDPSSYFHPPWDCQMKTVWKSLDTEYFPRYLQTGECQTKKCVLNLYECIPKLYPVKILRRDPNRCNPVPSFGLNTTYEERWYFESKHVTVCCECGRRVRPSHRRSRKRY